MTSYPYNLGQCFDSVAAKHAKQPALRFAGGTQTYEHLSVDAERLCALLHVRGLVRGDVIAIGHNKHALSYALMIAALRLGIAYVNIDVASPPARGASILATSGARLLFGDDPQYEKALSSLASGHGCEYLMLSQELLSGVPPIDQVARQALTQGVDGATIAYVMFTSGSTGIPKGVAVTHQNVLHLIAWGQARFEVTASDNFANLSPMYFDNSVFDFYVGLFSGASLSPIPRGLLSKPYDLVAHVTQMACTIWFSVPSLLIYLTAMKALAPGVLPALRAISFGGEGYPKTELKKLYARFSGQAALVNVYGPTECTCICSAYTISDADFVSLDGLPPLGKLNPNFDYRILDDGGQDALAGELCLIGPNVAAGYFNDLVRTEAAFKTLTDPGRFMKRMYRTGDLVEEKFGILYFVGRADNQIKHMGYRIELEEIEHALGKLPGVSQAAAVYHRTNAAYGKLIGFVATSNGDSANALLANLTDLLPDYMVPARLVVLPTLPFNANGKVDRHALRQMLTQASDEGKSRA